MYMRSSAAQAGAGAGSMSRDFCSSPRQTITSAASRWAPSLSHISRFYALGPSPSQLDVAMNHRSQMTPEARFRDLIKNDGLDVLEAGQDGLSELNQRYIASLQRLEGSPGFEVSEICSGPTGLRH